MPILYSTIARGQTVLCEYAITTGNFQVIAQSVLQKIPPQDQKMSYTYDNYFFHLMTRNQITYLCLCDADLGRRRPFLFLEKLASETEQRYGERITNAMVYGLMEFSGQLGTLMDYYSQDQSDSFQTVQTQVDQVKDIMVNNIEKILERGERIDMLVDKTGQLSQQSDQFKKRSTALRRAMWYKNQKLVFLMAGLGILGLYFLYFLFFHK